MVTVVAQVSLPCLHHWLEGGKEEEVEEPRQYSWDLARQTLDLSQFTIDRSILANGCEMYTCRWQMKNGINNLLCF